MLEAELSKEVKKAPVVEYEVPKKIFMKQGADSGVEDSLLVKLWDFS
jgi:U3 small nucleolar RNA-associated protein 19